MATNEEFVIVNPVAGPLDLADYESKGMIYKHKLYPAKLASRMLGVQKPALYYKYSRGLKQTKIGGSSFIKGEDIIEWMTKGVGYDVEPIR